MQRFNYTITDPLGMHAQSTAMLVNEVLKYSSSITINKEGSKLVDAKGMFSVMKLNIRCGDDVTVIINGEDEQEAANELEIFFKNNL